MTEQLEKAWKASSKPFHNETIFTKDLVPIGALQAFASSIVRHMELYYIGNSLFLFDDWHSHDGYTGPNTGEPRLLANPASLTARVGRFYRSATAGTFSKLVSAPEII